MSSLIKGFQRLLISRPARALEYGLNVERIFAKASLPVQEVADDEALSQHPQAGSPGTLQVLLIPPMGWVTRAELGILATRAREYYLNPVSGCRFGCTYCYLLAMPQGRRPLRLYIEVDDLLRSIDRHLEGMSKSSPGLFCTGELADSLTELDLFPIAAVLTEYFGRLGHARLELRTKSDNVSGLLALDHRGNTTVAFSISPQQHVADHEPGTASLSQRVEAGRKCQEAGYPVALKFEPLILTKDWQKLYEEALGMIASGLDVGALNHVSIGCLRWSKQLAEVPAFAKRYDSITSSGTWIEYQPGAFNGTVCWKDRVDAYDWMRKLLRRHGLVAPIWWSLEEPELINEMEHRDV